MEKLKQFINKYETNTLYILLISLLAAMFFSATFLINRSISIDGGHWYWSGALRFFFTLVLMSIVIILFKGSDFLKKILLDYKNNFIFWNIAGTLGFGVFYSMICFASDFSPAWMVATTWQLTIIASLFVLAFYGQKLSKKIWFFTVLIFIGICLVNFSAFNIDEFKTLIIGFVAVLIAAFAYPIGNQMVWEKKKKREETKSDKIEVLNNAFSKVFLLTLGSFPLWIVLFFVLGIDFLPSSGQISNVIMISFLSGVVGGSLFLYARSKANTSKKIMMVDACQSGEVIFTLIGEIIFLNLAIPGILAFAGVVITIIGLIAITKMEK